MLNMSLRCDSVIAFRWIPQENCNHAPDRALLGSSWWHLIAIVINCKHSSFQEQVTESVQYSMQIQQSPIWSDYRTSRSQNNYAQKEIRKRKTHLIFPFTCFQSPRMNLQWENTDQWLHQLGGRGAPWEAGTHPEHRFCASLACMMVSQMRANSSHFTFRAHGVVYHFGHLVILLKILRASPNYSCLDIKGHKLCSLAMHSGAGVLPACPIIILKVHLDSLAPRGLGGHCIPGLSLQQTKLGHLWQKTLT